MSAKNRLKDAAARLQTIPVETPGINTVLRTSNRTRIHLRMGLAAVVLTLVGSGAYLLVATQGGPIHSATHHSVVPWIDSKFTKAGLTATSSSSTPPCSAADVAASDVGEFATVGHRAARFAFTNTSSAPCILIGAPIVTASIPDAAAAMTATTASSVISDPGPPLAIGPGGVADVNVENDQGCGASSTESFASSVTFTLPNGGGSLSIEIPSSVQVEIDSSCGIQTTNFGVIPTASSPSTPSPLEAVKVAISAPASVASNSTVTYDVLLTNPTNSSISLNPCPSYLEWLGVGSNRVSGAYELNCSNVSSVGAGSTITYQMLITLPAGFPAGSGTLHWSLGGTSVFAQTDISVQ